MTRAHALLFPAWHRCSRFVRLLFGSTTLLLFSPQLFATEQLTLQLNGHHQFQFAGYYAAQFKGFYRDAGLQVELREGEPGMDTTDSVLSGQAGYGIGNSDLLLARVAGKPVVALAAMMQHSPLAILTLPDSNILHLSDLAQKRVSPDPSSRELIAYLHTRYPDAAPTLVPYQRGSSALLQGEADAIATYGTDDAYQLQRQGLPYRLLRPIDSEIDFYGNILFTSERELQMHPDRVLAFHQASLKGWRYAMEHQEEVINWLLSRHPSGSGREQLAFEADETERLLQPNLVEIGYMYEGRWQQIAHTYLNLGLIANQPDLGRFLYNPDKAQDNRQLRKLEQRISLALLIGFSLLTLVSVFCYLYLRLRRESRERQQLTQRLAQRERHYRFVAEHSADVIWTMEVSSRRFNYLSPAISQLCGWNREEAMSLSLPQVMPKASIKRLDEELDLALAAWQRGDHAQTRRVIRLELHHKDGQSLTTETVTTLHGNEAGEPDAIIGVTRDITEQAAVAQTMERLAFYDPLTNLPNRRLLHKRLNQALAEHQAQPLALLFIDLDHFKPINDTLGHEVGDALLIMVAERMSRLIGKGGIVARLGGDEFVIMLPGMGAEALPRAEQLQRDLLAPYYLSCGRELRISNSIGIALYPEHGRTARELMHHADLAMYQTKHGGRGQVSLYAPDLALDQGALQWNASHQCGHPRIDAEHHQLFVLANRLLRRMKTREQEPEAFRQALQALFDATRRHFAFEETLLEAIDFHDKAQHKEEHRRLLSQAQALADASMEELDNHAFLNFILQELVVGHMNKTDRSYFAQVKAHLYLHGDTLVFATP